MSCGIRCFGAYKWSLYPLYRPPPGGWSCPTLPPGLIDSERDFSRLSFVWKQKAKGQNNNPEGAVEEVIAFLRQNGLHPGADKKLLLSDFLDDYWCSLEPTRCPVRAPRDDPPEVRAQSLEKIFLPWAKDYWEDFNRAVAVDSDTPAEVVDQMARHGLELLAGPDGCPTCLEHWTELLAAYPPLALVTSPDHARAWLWASHAASREGRPAIPYAEIAEAWDWPTTPPQRVMDLLLEMRMTGKVGIS